MSYNFVLCVSRTSLTVPTLPVPPQRTTGCVKVRTTDYMCVKVLTKKCTLVALEFPPAGCIARATKCLLCCAVLMKIPSEL